MRTASTQFDSAPRIICLTGRIGAGKTTVAEYLVETHQFESLSFADHVIAPRIRAAGDPVNRSTLQNWGARLFAEMGEMAMVAELAGQIRHDGKYVIDDVRYPDTARFFLDQFQACFVFVDAPQRLRTDRVISRGRDQVTSQAEVLALDAGSTEVHIEGLGELAQINLMNDGTLDDLRAAVDAFLCDRS